MKICPKCGSQLVDEAVLCVHCGISLNDKQSVPVQQQFRPQRQESDTLVSVASFVASLLMAVAVVFLAVAVMTAIMSSTSDYWYEDCVIWAAVFSVAAALSSLVSLIAAIVKRLNLHAILSSISGLSWSVVVIIISCIYVANII